MKRGSAVATELAIVDALTTIRAGHCCGTALGGLGRLVEWLSRLGCRLLCGLRMQGSSAGVTGLHTFIIHGTTIIAIYAVSRYYTPQCGSGPIAIGIDEVPHILGETKLADTAYKREDEERWPENSTNQRPGKRGVAEPV